LFKIIFNRNPAMNEDRTVAVSEIESLLREALARLDSLDLKLAAIHTEAALATLRDLSVAVAPKSVYLQGKHGQIATNPD
jgi:hypothetical protein